MVALEVEGRGLRGIVREHVVKGSVRGREGRRRGLRVVAWPARRGCCCLRVEAGRSVGLEVEAGESCGLACEAQKVVHLGQYDSYVTGEPYRSLRNVPPFHVQPHRGLRYLFCLGQLDDSR